jgi:hypothetical protein
MKQDQIGCQQIKTDAKDLRRLATGSVTSLSTSSVCLQSRYDNPKRSNLDQDDIQNHKKESCGTMANGEASVALVWLSTDCSGIADECLIQFLTTMATKGCVATS